jgi:two-component system, OmpR family, sensor kinase
VRPRRWHEWTLRTRMVVAIATLAAVGIVVTDVAGVLMLRNQLVRRIDDQLRGEARGGFRTQLGRVTGRRPPFGPDSRFLAYYAGGTPYTTPAADDPPLGGFASLKAHADGKPYTVGGWRVLVTTLPESAIGPRYVVNAVSLTEVRSTESQLLLIDLSVSTLVLVLIGVAAATVVRLGLRPLTRMEATATMIAGGDLSRRVESTDPHTEAGRLGIALNTMLGQIESALAARTASEQRLRQFLADASHELRTPLTSIQGFAELYRRGGAQPGPALDEAMGRIESEVARMALLVGDLMLLARMDEERPLERHPVDLLEVAADAVRDAHVRVPTRFVGRGALNDSDDTTPAPPRVPPHFEPVNVLGDEPRLRQVATNLVANALQHTPDDALVEVRVGRPGLAAGNGHPPVAAVGDPLPPGQPVAALEVVDTGPGMPAEAAVRAFERLYRADPSRSRRGDAGAAATGQRSVGHGGAGLGLSIVAAIVQAHGGRVELWTAPGRGARFRVLLPAEPPVTEEDDGDGFRGSSEET